MQIEKVYRVIHQSWTEGSFDNHNHRTHFEGYYLCKEEADIIYKAKESTIGIYASAGVFINEINVVFNEDKSFNEVSIDNTKHYLT